MTKHPQPVRSWRVGDDRTEANPPLFSSDTTPLKTAPPLVGIWKRLVDTPPITSSLTICQAGELVGARKSKRILSDAAWVFMVMARPVSPRAATRRSEVAAWAVIRVWKVQKFIAPSDAARKHAASRPTRPRARRRSKRNQRIGEL